MPIRKVRFLTGAVLGLLIACPLAAQVSVAPTALFLSEQERFGGLYISNTSTSPQEVNLEFRFGYPASDSVGAVFMAYPDSTTSNAFSISRQVRAFPQRFVLPPGETQVVRLTANPSSDAADGLYWTRVVTTSLPQVEFEDNTDVDGIQTRVQFRLQQVTALFYRKGSLDLNLEVGEVTASADSVGVAVKADLTHSGNGPFFGNAHIRVLDDRDRTIIEEDQSLAIYVSGPRRFVVVVPEELAAGSYSAEITFTSERNDLPQSQLIQFEPVRKRAQFNVMTDPGSTR